MLCSFIRESIKRKEMRQQNPLNWMDRNKRELPDHTEEISEILQEKDTPGGL